MPLILKEYEVCPYASTCPHHSNGSTYCHGSNPNRKHIFECKLFVDGKIMDGYRNPLDQTGKMKIILE